MGDQHQDKDNQYLQLLLEYYQEYESEKEEKDIFSCSDCPLRPSCTGYVSPIMITRLTNSLLYFLDYVFIIHHNPLLYQLTVINGNKVLLNEYLEDLYFAKQLFLFHFGPQAAVKDLQPDWVSFHPCSDWLEEKLSPLDAC